MHNNSPFCLTYAIELKKRKISYLIGNLKKYSYQDFIKYYKWAETILIYSIYVSKVRDNSVYVSNQKMTVNQKTLDNLQRSFPVYQRSNNVPFEDIVDTLSKVKPNAKILVFFLVTVF